MTKLPLILASSSPYRKKLLYGLGIQDIEIIPANIDESPQQKEDYTCLVKRLAKEKCEFVASRIDNGIILAADTIVFGKGKLLEKAASNQDVRNYLRLASGSRKRVYTAVYALKKQNNQITQKSSKLVKSVVAFKRLTNKEIEDYVASNEGIGKAGGFAINGCAQSYIKWMRGSISAIIGLPLYETSNILKSMGCDIEINNASTYLESVV